VGRKSQVPMRVTRLTSSSFFSGYELVTRMCIDMIVLKSACLLSKETYSRCFGGLRYRQFSVKELSWCAKSSRPAGQSKNTLARDETTWTPIDRFGIVACISRNRVIGVNGALPWDIPEDRKRFTELTKGTILVVGRKTFQERPNQSHVSHAAACIVISKTLQNNLLDTSALVASGTELHIAQSFPQALHVARELQDRLFPNTVEPTTTTMLNCWVAGGEPVFHAAIMHPSAKVLDLTVVDVDIDTASSSSSTSNDARRVCAKFPPKYHWDIRFQQVSAVTTTTQGSVENHTMTAPISITHQVFHRVKGRR
jgi:dihydrofolate reductase